MIILLSIFLILTCPARLKADTGLLKDASTGLRFQENQYSNCEFITNDDDAPFLMGNEVSNARRDQSGFSLISRWGRSACRSIELKDMLLIYSNGSTIFIADVSDPNEHNELAHILLPAPITEIMATDEMIYAVVYLRGVYAIDYSDMESLQIVDSTEVFWGYRASADGDYMAVAAFAIPENGQESPYGFRLFDISEPERMEEVALHYIAEGNSFNRIVDILVRGEQCFVLDYEYGLRIFDISNPAEPNEAANIDLRFGGNTTSCKSMVLRERLIFMSGFGMLFIYDISDLDNIQTVSITRGIGDLFTICDSILFANRDTNQGLCIWNISDPVHPRTIFSTDTSRIYSDLYGCCEDLETDGSTLYYAYLGYNVFDVTNLEQPWLRYRQQDGGYIHAIIVESDRVMCYATRRLFSILYDEQYEFEFGNISYEFEVEDDNQWYANTMVGKDSYYYLFGNLAFKIIDAINQDSVFEVSTIELDYGDLDLPVEINNDRLYITGRNRFGIWDVSDPRDPVELGNYRFSMPTGSMVQNQRAYLFSGADVHVIDISDPGNCHRIGQFQVNGYVLDAVIENDLLYTANGYTRDGRTLGALIIIDISNLNNTQELSSFYIEGAIFWTLIKEGNTVFLAGENAGVFAVDVSNAHAPREVAHYDIITKDITVQDSLIFVLGPLTISNDITVLRFDNSNAVIEDKSHFAAMEMKLNVYPNPVNSAITIDFYVPSPGDVEVVIFDLTGREIVSIFNDYLPSGRYKHIWSTQNIPTGLYMLRFHANSVDEKRKIIIIR